MGIMHQQAKQNKCCVSMFYITTEKPSICKFSKANQTVDANTGSLGAFTVLYVCERESTPHYPNKDNKYLFTRSASCGCLHTSLHTRLININMRPICAWGEREGEEKKGYGHNT